MSVTPQTSAAPPPAADFALARFNMVESQLRPNGVTDSRLIEAMGRIPRELFVPSTLVGVAYLDENIPLIASRTLMQPMVLAKLIQATEVKPQDRVLDLAPATGYSTLLLAAMGAHIVGVEPDSLLHKEAETNIATYAPTKAEILAGAPVEGCIAYGPFDVILINGSVEFVPEILFKQLADGGRLSVIVRHFGTANAAHTGQARLYRKKGDEVTWEALFDANVPPAPGFTSPRGFEF